MEITLTDTEIAMLRILADMRTLMNRSAGIKNRKVSHEANHVVELDGIIGEYAFCKLKNVFMDFTAQPRSGSADCQVNGKNIDIKATRHSDGRLLGYIDRNPDVDIFVLAIIEGNHVSFPGWATADQLYDPINLGNINHNPVYLMTQNQLNKFKT